MNQATRNFINRHAEADVRQLALQGCRQPDVDLPLALDQIAGRQKARTKLPAWAATEGIVYPPRLSMEQCSSERTATYKARLAERLLAALPLADRRLADLTGGFGVDFAYMSQAAGRAVYVERQPRLCAIAKENFARLGLTGVQVVCADAADYLQAMPRASLIFLDPARRDQHGDRTYDISDCTPNLMDMKETLLQKGDAVMVKLAPMLDWRKAVVDLGREVVREVHIVSVGNECKELLLVLAPGEGLRLVCTNDNETFEPGRWPVEGAPALAEGALGTYLYEPNASIMKTGCFSELSACYGVTQLERNSHLFTADRLIADFPGRRFAIDAVSTMNKRELKEKLGHLSQANLTVRNFPMGVGELRRRLKLGEGGSAYVFATTLTGKRHVLLVCHKVS